MRVLLVEDNLAQAVRTRFVIQAMPGWFVTHVETLAEAKEAVRSEGAAAFDLALVDLTLPDAHNLEAVIFAREAMPNAACVVVSGEEQVHVANAALRYGVSDYLVKTSANMADPASMQRALQLAVTRRDLTAQEEQSKEDLRGLLTGLQDAIFVIDDAGGVLFENPVAEKLAVAFAKAGPNETLVQARADMVEQMTVKDGSGGEVPVEVRTRPLTWAGSPARLVVLRDMGPERRAQTAEAHMRKIAALAAIGDEAYNDWHDVKNKLQGLQGALDDLHDRSLVLGIEAGEPYGVAKSLIAEIGQIALKYYEGGVKIRNVRESVNLRTLVESKCLAFRRNLDQERLRWNLQETAPVLGDAVELAGVVENLLMNALKAIRRVSDRKTPGTIQVFTFMDGERAVVRVMDDGPGFSGSHARYWERGVTGDATGLGRGLAKVRETVEKHSGDVGIQSTAGSGATVTFRLPVAQTTARGKRRVLLIEDDQYAGPAAKRMLGRSYEVELCTDGQEALETLEQDQNFDAIVCDLEMPRVDGVTFFRRAVERWPGLSTRIAFCSGGALNADVSRFLREGSVPMLPKPMVAADAVALIEAIASGKHVGAR